MKKLFAILLAAMAVFVHLPGQAEDIDLFSSPPVDPNNPPPLPNVLIIVDNSANWNSVFSMEKAALKATFDALPLNKFRVGVMFFSESGGSNGNPDGGVVRAAIRPMDATNRPKYSAFVNGLSNSNPNSDKGNGRDLALTMAEAYLYYAGLDAYAGHNKVKRDYAGNSITPTATYGHSNAVWALPGNAFTSSTSSRYVSPVDNSGCQRNFIIYIGNSTAGGNVTKDQSANNSQSGTILSNVGGDTSQVTDISPAGDAGNYSDEWARFMKQVSPLSISTYTIDVNMGGAVTGDADNSALLKSMANQGGGKYFYINGQSTTLQDDIEKALSTIFSEIQSVNSVFASVSLPVSVNTQGSYLNQVYIGMFRPDVGSAPRWAGNLKQYKLGLVGNDLRLQDADGVGAINTQTGFITECARSFWTPTTLDNYWSFKAWPAGTTFCIPPAGTAQIAYQRSNWPDGNIVEKGAQAYKLRAINPNTRKLYTCGSTMAGCGSMVDFVPNNVTPGSLGVSTTAERDDLVQWARGRDLGNEDNDASLTEMRSSIHGDVVHSRPVAVNFNESATTAATSRVVVFYGGNDGMLRAINGNRGSPTDSTVGAIDGFSPGQEMWSFMPPEAYSNLKRLKDNTTLVQLRDETYGPDAVLGPKPYGMDGPITAFKGSVGGSNKIFIYATMRRGGRSIYAFDVTNMMSDGDSPTFKWRVGCSTPLGAGTDDCSTGMSNMAQSWSSLKPFTTAGHGSGATHLVIMGGGYDTCEDHDGGAGGANHNCTSSSKGGSIYVLDANTGAVVKEFVTGENRGVIADVTLVRDSTGQVILGYTADLGGNVYRLKFGNGAAASWTITKIASLGCDTTATCTANRKFFFAPSVATSETISENATYYILLGTGDREKPVRSYGAATAVQNYFFQFRDKPGDNTWPGSTDCGADLICLNSLINVDVSSTTSPTASQVAARKGWALRLSSTEQVVTSAVTVFGVTTFSTHQPATSTGGVCAANLGTTKVYNVNYATAGPGLGDTRSEDVAGDGLPPSPVAGQVTLDDGTTVPFVIGSSPRSPLEGRLPTTASSAIVPKGRLYWYIEK